MNKYDLLIHIEDNIVELEEGLSDSSLNAAGSAASIIAGAISHITPEKLAWKKAVAKHDELILKLKRSPKNENLRKAAAASRIAKEKARVRYVIIRDNMQKKSAKNTKSGIHHASTFVKNKAMSTGKAIINGANHIKSKLKTPNALGALHNYITTNFHR